jgi:hypothetical protein
MDNCFIEVNMHKKYIIYVFGSDRNIRLPVARPQAQLNIQITAQRAGHLGMDIPIQIATYDTYY